MVTRNIAGEVILIPVRQNAGEVASIYTMNEVSAFIWEQIDGEKQVGEIRDAIVEEFETDPQQAEADLIEFLLQLEQVGAVIQV